MFFQQGNNRRSAIQVSDVWGSVQHFWYTFLTLLSSTDGRIIRSAPASASKNFILPIASILQTTQFGGSQVETDMSRYLFWRQHTVSLVTGCLANAWGAVQQQNKTSLELFTMERELMIRRTDQFQWHESPLEKCLSQHIISLCFRENAQLVSCGAK